MILRNSFISRILPAMAGAVLLLAGCSSSPEVTLKEDAETYTLDNGIICARVSKVTGDLDVDSHHTIEDTGIVLGQAIRQALGEKAGIRRYGYFILPMDEVLALSAIDLCGRPYLRYSAEFTVPRLGTMDTEMIREFFYAVSYGAAMNLHLKILESGNNHHMAEALFKAFGKALDMAVSEEPRIKDVWSTKGTL